MAAEALLSKLCRFGAFGLGFRVAGTSQPGGFFALRGAFTRAKSLTWGFPGRKGYRDGERDKLAETPLLVAQEPYQNKSTPHFGRGWLPYMGALNRKTGKGYHGATKPKPLN